MKLFAVALVATVVAMPASASATTPDPKAFQRPAQADDDYSGPFTRWQISESRLVAQAVVRRPARVNTARLYLVRRKSGLLCMILQDRGGHSASCTPSSAFARGITTSGRLLVGVVRNDVTRVVVIGTRGVRHPVKLTADKGFIWDCRAWNGCTTVVDAIAAYNNAGRLLYRVGW